MLTSAGAWAQPLLKLPHGLKWGDSPEALLAWADRNSLDVTITMPAAEPALRIVRAEAPGRLLPEGKAAALEGRFLKGRLFEVTEHHADPNMPVELFEARFEETRKLLTHEYGALLTNRQERSVDDHFVTKTRSFHREPVKGLMLMLVFTEVEDTLRKSKTARFSIIHRNENFRKEMMGSQDGR